MKTLRIIRGLPGSGKSTLASKMTDDGFFHVEADMYFMNNGKYNFDVMKLPEAHGFCKRMVKQAMSKNVNVVVSNTFSTYTEMEAYVEMAKTYGYEIEVIEATGEYESVHDVPQSTIDKMKSRWESYDSVKNKVISKLTGK